MSVIMEALRKTGGLSSVFPPPPDRGFRRIVRWICTALAAGCFGLALAALGNIIFHPKRSSSARESVPPATAATPVVSSQEPAAALNFLRIAEAQWRLNGVLHEGDGKAIALINGQIVEEGSTFQGARVVRVASDRVVLERDGKTKTLDLR